MKSSNIINVSCFGALRPLKNQLSQALAAIQFADSHGYRLQFHINATRTEQQGQNILKNLRGVFGSLDRHQLVEHPWMDHADFMKVLRDEIDLGMQVSYTETYNIVAADHIAAGVPIVTSSEVRFVLPIFHADPNSVPSMVRRLIWAWHLRRCGVPQINRWLLNRSNDESRHAWSQCLANLLDGKK